MDVQDPVGEGADHRWPQDAHEPREQDVPDGLLLQESRQGVFVLGTGSVMGREEGDGPDPPSPSSFERPRLRLVRDHEGNPPADVSVVEKGLKVGAGDRSEYRGAWVHWAPLVVRLARVSTGRWRWW